MASVMTEDEEFEAMMAEIEAQTESLLAEEKAAAAAVSPAPAPAPVAAPVPETPPWDEEMVIPEGAQAEEDLAAVLETVATDMITEDKLSPIVEAAPTPAPKSEPAPALKSVPEPASSSDPSSFLAPSEMEEDPPARGLNYYVDVSDFRRDTRVTESNLDACMMEQAGLRAYYGAQAANAEAQASRLKVTFEILEAQLYDKQRKALAVAYEKVTEKMVENAVKVDPKWSKAKNRLIEADTIAAINKSLVESIKDRRDMIIQLGADRREEFKGQTRIMAGAPETQPAPGSLAERAARAARSSHAA
jgi:hypothetical protein